MSVLNLTFSYVRPYIYQASGALEDLNFRKKKNLLKNLAIIFIVLTAFYVYLTGTIVAKNLQRENLVNLLNKTEFENAEAESIFIILIVAAVASRLFFIQIISHQAYLDLAKKQQGFSRILEPKRGDIYYKNKNGELAKAATTKVGSLLYLNTKLLKESENTFNKLNAVTSIDRDLFNKIVKKINDPYEILKHRISREEADKIAVLNLPGVGLDEERWRDYPAGALGSHILGFISALSADESATGKYGAEKYYDGILKGAPGKISGDSDPKGILIALSEASQVNPTEGQDLVLTIEPIVQRAAEEELKKLKEKWRATAGGILIIDPKTGAIKALAGSPDFDPNKYQTENNL